MDKVIESFSAKIIRCFLNQDIIDETQKEVYQYGIIVTSQAVIIMISLLIIGLIFGLFFENLCFMIVFKILRKFSGGLHSDKFSVCFSLSIVLNVLFLFTYKLFILVPNFIIIIPIELVSSLILVLFSPKKNKNKNISKKESRIYKLIVTIICVFVFLFSVVLISNNNFLVYSMCIAALLDAFFVVLGYLKTSSIV